MAKARTRRKTIQAERFGALILRGYSQVDAWAEAVAKPADLEGMAREAQWKAASRFANDPLVQTVVARMRETVKVAMIDDHVKFHTDLINDVALARESGNWNAVMQGNRIRGLSANHLKETFNVTDSRHTTEDLLARIGAIAPGLDAVLRSAFNLPADAPDGNVVPIKKTK